jgi:hypothetical protein
VGDWERGRQVKPSRYTLRWRWGERGYSSNHSWRQH